MDNERLEKAFKILRMKFFPRWDRKGEWNVELDHELPSEGQCLVEEKIIKDQHVPEDDDKLYLLLTHEICHAYFTGHGKRWQNRMLGIANKDVRKSISRKLNG